jgi:GTP-binding protein
MNAPANSSVKPFNVVIVGRPNVGKSSLFNRLLGRKRALVLDTPGVTRDRIIEPASWWVAAREYEVSLIDTGGLGEGRFKEEIARQVDTALTDATVVLFVMDIRAGLTGDDREVFKELRKSGVLEQVPMIGILNKADHENLEEDVSEFYELGFDRLMPLSAEHALGIDDLKDMIVELAGATPKELVLDADGERVVEAPREEVSYEGLTEEEAEAKYEELEKKRPRRLPAIAIVGQPNVGKSTMLNAICGEKRVVVSPIAGTTVDSIDTKLTWHGKDYLMVDTAGIRRKNKTEQGIEVLSVVQTKKTLERADVALLVMDGETGVYDQDEKIAGLIEESGTSVIMVLNKWDTQVNNPDFSQKLAEEQVRKQIRFLGYAPLVFTTAKDSVGLDRLYRMIDYVLEQRSVKLGTRELTEFIRNEVDQHNPDNAKFYFVHQAGRNPPTFVAHVNDPKKIHFSMSRHLIRTIREKWGFLGSPIRFHFLKAKNTGEKSKK